MCSTYFRKCSQAVAIGSGGCKSVRTDLAIYFVSEYMGEAVTDSARHLRVQSSLKLCRVPYSGTSRVFSITVACFLHIHCGLDEV